MNRKIFIFIIPVLICLKSFGQFGPYLRFDLGPTGDVFQYTDNGRELGTRPVFDGIWGLAIGHEFTSLFAGETGFYWNYYTESFYFKNMKISTGSSGVYDVCQIPLRLKGGINIYRDILILGTTIGLSYCINPDYTFQSTGSGSIINGKDTISYDFKPKGFNIKNFFLLETGLFLDMKLFKGFHLCLTSSYFSGFKKLYENSINYHLNSGTIYNAATTTNGDYFNILFGLKYVIHRKS